MPMEFSKRLDLFGPEIFAALNDRKIALEAQGRTLYNLSVGTPDFPPAPHIKQALLDAAAQDENWKYSLRDLPEMLDAVGGYYKRRFGVEGITRDKVMSVSGSQDGIGHLGLALLNDGDTVLLPDPCYPVFMTGMRAGRRRALVLYLNPGKPLPAGCARHPGRNCPQGKGYACLFAGKPGRQHRHAGTVPRNCGFLPKI